MSEEQDHVSAEAVAARVTAEIEKVGAIYAGFMHEISLRLAGVEAALIRIAEGSENESTFLDAEFCFLQLRMICEDIALAALVAHNELPEANSKALLKSWNADVIFDRLAGVNEHCYPVPQKVVALESGEKQLQPIEAPYLTRTNLKKVYHACGENLHRGILLHVLEGKRRAYDIQLLREWVESILQLLEQHVVLLPDLNAGLIVRMSDEHGEVSCSRMVGLEGDSFVVSSGKDVTDAGTAQEISAQSDVSSETKDSTAARSPSS